MKAELVQHNHVQKISINGKVYDPVSFRSFWPQPHTVNNFSRYGTSLMSIFPTGILCHFNVPYSQFGEIWEGEGRYNWENLRKQVDMFVENAPDAYFSLMVQLDTRDWFLQENPECSDTFVHLAQTAGYQKWRNSAARFMCDLIDYLDKHYPEKIFGVHLLGGKSTEWFTLKEPGKYNALQEQIYQQWSSDEQLKTPAFESLHHTEYGVFRHPIKDKAALDYWHFHNEVVGDAISWFAKTVKEHTNGTRLVGVFYGYLTALAFNNVVEDSSNALVNLLNDPNVDIFISPASYSYRMLESTSAFHVPVDSLKLHGKLYFHEIDNTTHVANDNQYAQKLQAVGHVRMENMYETVMYSRRESALAISKGVGYWWFDMFSGWYDNDELMRELENIKKAAARLYQKPMRSSSEVAVFVDQESYYYTDYKSDLLESLVVQQLEGLQRMGMPWDCYVAEDIDHEKMPHRQYKLYVFLNLIKPSKKIADKIQKLKEDGKSMLFIYAAGLITDSGFSIASMEQLTGLKLNEFIDSEETHVVVPIGNFNRSHSETRFGMCKGVSPMFEVVERGCTVIGRYEESAKVGFALKERKGGFDAWSAVGGVSGAVLKELARQAGAFVYSETDDPVYGNENMIGFFSHTGGERVLKLPYAGRLEELYTGEKHEIDRGSVNLSFQPNEMKLFEIIREA